MATERTGVRMIPKPWGNTDLRPWNARRDDGEAIGEVWFERSDKDAPDPALLLKLLFTTAPLSIQVHPDDVFAQTIGLAHGKTEAWYVLSARPGARVAVGLRRTLTASQLRASIGDGSIAELVQWRGVTTGDVVFVPAGTIHAIGAGLVVAEIQQRSDTTFRLYDYGRQRELHVDNAVAAARAAPADNAFAQRRLSDARTLLVACPAFTLERIDLPPGSRWELQSERETWLLVVEGQARMGTTRMAVGDAVFLEADQLDLTIGVDGLRGLIAYPGDEPIPGLLHAAGMPVHA